MNTIRTLYYIPTTIIYNSKCTILSAIIVVLFYVNTLNVNAQEEQIPLVRLPSNTLLKYTAYKDVSILHFRIPTDTRTAMFSFKAYEESKSAFQRECQPKNITLHLKAGSYPVISPENIEFPKHFLSADQRYEIFHLQFESDGTTKRLNIDGPHPGNWFAVAFISWTDPNNERIEQQGLAASCETLLLSEMSVIPTIPIIIHENNMYTNELFTNNTEPISYKFFVPRNIEMIVWTIEILSICIECTNDLSIYVQANGLPNSKNFIDTMQIGLNETGNYTITFYPQNYAWHYVDIDFITTADTPQDILDDEQLLQNNTKNLNKTMMTATTTSATTTTTIKPTTITPNVNIDLNISTTVVRGINSSITNKDIQNDTLPINKIEFNVQFAFVTIEELSIEMPPLSGENVTADTSSSPTPPPSSEPSSTPVPSIDEQNETIQLPFRNLTYYPLIRQTYREFFMFDYDLLPDLNGTVPAYLNLTGGEPSGFHFDVGDVYDIGGTLTFGIVMKDTLKELEAIDAIIEKEKLTKNINITTSSSTAAAAAAAATDDEPQQQRSNQTIIICMRLNEPGVPTWPDKCVYGKQILPATNIVNNTNEDTSTGLINIPFPESGKWFITFGLFCHGHETQSPITIIDSVKDFVRKNINIIDDMQSQAPCACTNNLNNNQTTDYKKCLNDKQCLESLSESDILKVKECLMDSKCTVKYKDMINEFNRHHKYVTEQKMYETKRKITESKSQNGTGRTTVMQSTQCNASVIFTITSNPCVNGRCGRYGRCYHYMSGGFVFSTCLCMKGYRGWDCSEDSQVPSSFSILLALLLLTLSNLLFIPSIYFAMKRKYYTEGVIYFFAMFFSIFYHACDSGEDEYSFCLVKIGVLQFCDFYCGLLAIWVTLIAMAHIRQTFVSLLHMFGAILLAFGTELNKQSLWVFLAPALTGLCIISLSWGWRCRRTHKWFPARKYLAVFLPIGMCLVMIGLICYAFLQTRQNYHVVHSIWHMVMALSILCLLPNKKSFLPKC